MANAAFDNGLGAAAAEAAEGRRALVILPRGEKARASLEFLEKMLGPRVDRVYRTKGQEQALTKAGGSVRFAKIGHGAHHRYSAHLLVLPDAIWRDEDHKAELLPTLSVTGGDVITY